MNEMMMPGMTALLAMPEMGAGEAAVPVGGTGFSDVLAAAMPGVTAGAPVGGDAALVEDALVAEAPAAATIEVVPTPVVVHEAVAPDLAGRDSAAAPVAPAVALPARAAVAARLRAAMRAASLPQRQEADPVPPAVGAPVLPVIMASGPGAVPVGPSARRNLPAPVAARDVVAVQPGGVRQAMVVPPGWEVIPAGSPTVPPGWMGVPTPDTPPVPPGVVRPPTIVPPGWEIIPAGSPTVPPDWMGVQQPSPTAPGSQPVPLDYALVPPGSPTVPPGWTLPRVGAAPGAGRAAEVTAEPPGVGADTAVMPVAVAPAGVAAVAATAVSAPVAAAGVPIVAAPVVTVTSQRLGDVSIGIEGEPEALRVRLAGSAGAAGLMAADAPRLQAELAATGIRLQSIDFGGRIEASQAGSLAQNGQGAGGPAMSFGGGYQQQGEHRQRAAFAAAFVAEERPARGGQRDNSPDRYA